MMTRHREFKTGYEPHGWHFCIDDYIQPDGEWSPCPCCGLRPKIWVFDNGRSTACGCWESKYDHFSVRAESIMSVYKRTGGSDMTQYNRDELRRNWNHWCATGEHVFVSTAHEEDGRW